jgi:hypothetical protein
LCGPIFFAGASVAAVKVMAVGDSLTEYNAYRARFAARATADNAGVTMVGPKPTCHGRARRLLRPRDRGVQQPQRDEHDQRQGGQTRAWRACSRPTSPDVVLLMVGTNNMNHGLGWPHANRYPNNGGTAAIAARVRERLNGFASQRRRVRTSNNPTFGTTYLKGEVAKIVNTRARTPRPRGS